MSEFTALGFDYGRKRIGLAVGQNLTRSATAIAQINVGSEGPNWEAIEKQIKEWSPQLLVVGLPLNMDESKSPMSKAAERFASQLEKRFGLPVKLIDERLSTREAKERLTLEKGNTRWSKAELNSTAAKVILETYLNLYAPT
jgi:putative Holliday junction resolvase